MTENLDIPSAGDHGEANDPGREEAPGAAEAPAPDENSAPDEAFCGSGQPAAAAIDLHADPERMRLLLDSPVPPPDPERYFDSLQAAVNHLEPADPPDREELERLVAAAEPVDGRLVDVVLAEGKPPVQPRDGRIDWTEDFFATGFMVDRETGRADYRERSATLSVGAGKLLARLFPPVAGEPGRDVFGDKIPVRRPHRARLRKGPNVRLEEDADGVVSLFAEIDGRIRFADGLLAVDEVYSISGSVGLQTGNVSHPGAVEISGDVRAGAKIEAKGDILVKGMVEPSDITAGGSLIVQGGLVGGRESRIEVDGGVKARYILEAEITAGGDVEAEREINHSRIRARGQVLVPQGRIAGGEVSALGGIVVGDAGAEGLGSTLLVCGVDFRLEALRSASGKRVRKLEQKRQKLVASGRQIMSIKKLSPMQKETLEKMRGQIREIDEEIRSEELMIEEAVFHSQQMARPGMRIGGLLFPETIIQLRDSRLKTSERMKGPLDVSLRNGLVSIQAP